MSSMWTCWRPLRENLEGAGQGVTVSMILKPLRSKVDIQIFTTLEILVERIHTKPASPYGGSGTEASSLIQAAIFTFRHLSKPLSQTPRWGMLNEGSH